MLHYLNDIWLNTATSKLSSSYIDNEGTNLDFSFANLRFCYKSIGNRGNLSISKMRYLLINFWFRGETLKLWKQKIKPNAKRIQEKLANTKTISLVLVVFASCCAKNITFCGNPALMTIGIAIVVTIFEESKTQ